MGTRETIVKAAQELIQTRGFNAFSFRDIADKVGIRAASVHHHFPTKADLGEEVIREYRTNLFAELIRTTASKRSPRSALDGFIEILNHSLSGGRRLCLCAALMSDSATLESGMKRELMRMVEEIEAWIGERLVEGRELGTFSFAGSPSLLARTIFASLQGIMTCSRSQDEPERFLKASGALLDLLE